MLLVGGSGPPLPGILHRPARPTGPGCVIVVGGPQYRVGAHRSFVLLARHLASRGVAVLRFDHRGIGDSGGEHPGFQAIGPDIGRAVDTLLAEVPEVREVVLWGLCDAVPPILARAAADVRIGRVVILNPWVRTPAGAADARLRHYYLRRLFSPDFWGRLFSGAVALTTGAREFLATLRDRSTRTAAAGPDLPDRMRDDLRRFRGRVLLITSGRDLVAAEFLDRVRSDPEWRDLLAQPRVRAHHLDDADHTFAKGEWRDRVIGWTADWLSEHPPARLSAPAIRMARPTPDPGRAGRVPVTVHRPSGAPLSALWFPPRGALRRTLLLCPAFGEEMNRCRRAVAVQADRLAALGIGTLVPDLSGTGDSPGDFGEARWEDWLDDAGRAAGWLRAMDTPTAVWGVRAGALLATALPDRVAGIDRLLLWQPVTDGAAFVRQLLRTATAARLGGPSAGERPRDVLARGATVEVGGYSLHPRLLDALARHRLSTAALPASLPVDWIELRADGALPPIAATIVEAWSDAGRASRVRIVDDAPIWDLWEPPLPERLIAATTGLAADW